jgi:hypothetical protein
MLPKETSLDDVKVRIKKTYSNPNVRTITQVVLKEGPRAFKIATMLELIDPKSGEFHHNSLKIDHIDKTREGWFAKPEKSVRLEGKEPDEIDRLFKFLRAAYENELSDKTGELHVISGKDYADLESLIDLIPNVADSDKIHLAKHILERIDENSSSFADFVTAFKGSNQTTLNHIAAASRMVEYTGSLNNLKVLVNDPLTPEGKFQKHLEVNPWMFGSEYSELLPRKTWTRDDRLDYMLRKTVDDYLEIVEIKTAFQEPLFLHDSSHDSYYPSAKLSPVIGQVTRYIEEVERNRDSILAKDGFDTLKIRARVIVGRDGTPGHQTALRNFNAHLHRIEIITYDQLLRIAERVLSVFGETAEPELEDEYDIPF